MRTNDARLYLALLTWLVSSSCSTAPKKGTEPPPSDNTSSVEINYMRGRNEHRLTASLRGDAAIARTFLDRQVLAESPVQRDKYLSFLHQAAEFLKVPRKAPGDHFPCRTPFTVKIQIGTEIQETSGCLGEDEGALSHLVRDGEFLLHQGSGMRIK